MKPIKYAVTKLDWCKESAVVPVEVFEDHSLTWQARGIMAYLCTRPYLEPVSAKELFVVSEDYASESGVSSALKELIDLGYVKKVANGNPD